MISTRTALGALVVIAAAVPAHAAVEISTAATQNMSCSGGVCAPTATAAVLNVGDLEALLASGNVTVTTTGSGVESNDVRVEAAVAWSTGSALTLEAFRSLVVDRLISVEALAPLTLTTVRTACRFRSENLGREPEHQQWFALSDQKSTAQVTALTSQNVQ
jgi:hypothetical protein